METQNINTPDSLWRPMTQHKMLLKNHPKHIVKAEGSLCTCSPCVDRFPSVFCSVHR